MVMQSKVCPTFEKGDCCPKMRPPALSPLKLDTTTMRSLGRLRNEAQRSKLCRCIAKQRRLLPLPIYQMELSPDIGLLIPFCARFPCVLSFFSWLSLFMQKQHGSFSPFPIFQTNDQKGRIMSEVIRRSLRVSLPRTRASSSETMQRSDAHRRRGGERKRAQS